MLEVNANIVTFIAAGHETTANVLYCLSQDDASRERLEREVDWVGEGEGLRSSACRSLER